MVGIYQRFLPYSMKIIFVCILPFNINRKFFIKFLNWNGFPFSDYNCPIVRNNFEFTSDHFELILSKIKKDV